ncbi:hypothetical protein MKW98_008872 [Papaver atlanticum]|uniref:Transferase n=2 Tax=Papaver atlanticum TaxID=357466 RepID=A0AAD4TGZ2_9MAGN|nr:hypothetical protein MKW98_008872 [Papaver atlanticum]
MKVEVVSREILKPSSPTPTHLKSYNLSLLDQVSPPFHVPLILYYQINDSDASSSKSVRVLCDLLKRSFAEALTIYYPFAGRVNENMIVDCNDDGIDYSEAKVSHCRLQKFIQESNIVELEKPFLPFNPSDGNNSDALLAVQVNVFEECGGIALGLCFSHKVADASSFTAFVTHWAAIARGTPEQVEVPVFKLSSLFPPKDVLKNLVSPASYSKEEMVTKKFVLEPSIIDELKRKAVIGSTSTNGESYSIAQEHKPVTRIEAVSAFLWKCFIDMDLSKNKGVPFKVYTASYSVNMRSKIVPPLPSNSIGNMQTITAAVSMFTSDTEKDQYTNLVGKVKNAIRMIDGGHVKELQTTDALLNNMELMKEQISSGQRVNMHFNSWLGNSLHKTDFGWGKPALMSICKLAFKNLVFLLDKSSGDGGIEAWVSLSKEDMTIFEHNEELKTGLSPPLPPSSDPSKSRSRTSLLARI